MVSIIIPTYNEENSVGPTLDRLGRVRGNFEVIVVDGESTDGTRERVAAFSLTFQRPLRCIGAQRLRALQLNRAAKAARGNLFLFLHADAVLPPEAIENLEAAFRNRTIVGGNFSLSFGGDSGWNRLFTWANRLRRKFGIYYGDSALFVRRDIFERLGGFKMIPVMDDYEFVRRLEKAGQTVCLPTVVVVSDRRWRQEGVFKTILSWALVQGLYSAGFPAQRLGRWYKPIR